MPPPSPPVKAMIACLVPGAVDSRIITPPLAQEFEPVPLLTTCAVIVPSRSTHSIEKRPTGFKILGKDDQSSLQQFVDEICGAGK